VVAVDSVAAVEVADAVATAAAVEAGAAVAMVVAVAGENEAIEAVATDTSLETSHKRIFIREAASAPLRLRGYARPQLHHYAFIFFISAPLFLHHGPSISSSRRLYFQRATASKSSLI
jgi:hypothetical protein